jgi:hypothetical protein
MADRLKCLALSTALGLLVVAPAGAQSVDELKAMVLKLQQRVEQLEANQQAAPQKPRPAPARPTPVAQGLAPAQLKVAQQAAEQAQKSAAEAQQAAAQAQQDAAQAKDTAAAEVKAAFAPPPGKPGGSFRIPGTETVMRAYGFMKLNGSDDLTTFNPSDALSAQSIPLFGTAAQRQGGGSQMSARRSRFDLETWTPVNDTYGDFHTLLEIDFAGQNTSLTTQATTSGYTPRLRKAYADFGKPVGGWGAVLVGQESSVYSDNPLLPIQWLNDLTFVGVPTSVRLRSATHMVSAAALPEHLASKRPTATSPRRPEPASPTATAGRASAGSIHRTSPVASCGSRSGACSPFVAWCDHKSI